MEHNSWTSCRIVSHPTTKPSVRSGKSPVKPVARGRQAWFYHGLSRMLNDAGGEWRRSDPQRKPVVSLAPPNGPVAEPPWFDRQPSHGAHFLTVLPNQFELARPQAGRTAKKPVSH